MKKRFGMNKKLIAIISVIIILCGAAAGLWYNRQHSAEQPKTPSTNVSDAAKFKSEYPRVAANNRFVYASDKESLISLITAAAWFSWAFRNVRGASI